MSCLINEFTSRLLILSNEEYDRITVSDNYRKDKINVFNILLKHILEGEESSRWLVLGEYEDQNTSIAVSFVLSFILASKDELQHQQQRNRVAWVSEEELLRKQLWNNYIMTRPVLWMTLNSCQLSEYTMRSIIKEMENFDYSKYVFPIISEIVFEDPSVTSIKDFEMSTRQQTESFENTDRMSLVAEYRLCIILVYSNTLMKIQSDERHFIESESVREYERLTSLISDVLLLDVYNRLLSFENNVRENIQIDEVSERRTLASFRDELNFFVSVISEEKNSRDKLIKISRKEKKIILTGLYLGSEGLITGLKLLQLEKEAYGSLLSLELFEMEARGDTVEYRDSDKMIIGSLDIVRDSLDDRHFVENKQNHNFSQIRQLEQQLRPKTVSPSLSPPSHNSLKRNPTHPVVVFPEEDFENNSTDSIEGELPFYNSPLREKRIRADSLRYVEGIISSPFTIWKSPNDSKLW